MARKVELVFDTEIKKNRTIGFVQIVLGVLALLISAGYFVMQGPRADFAFSLAVSLFMIITGMHTRR